MSWSEIEKRCGRLLGNYIGLHGQFWYKDSHKEVQRYVDEYENGEMEIDENGLARWVSSGNIVPYDCALMAYLGGVPIDPVACFEGYLKETEEFLAQYRASWRPPSDEAMAEMRAEFGAGTKMVDALSGRTFTL